MPMYFLTWTTYGTWLHGDERGSVDRDHRAAGTPYVTPDEQRRRHMASLAKHAAYTMCAPARAAVEAAIRSTASHRGWEIRTLAVRTNHIHVVLEADRDPDRVLADLKAWATRALREAGIVPAGRPLWTTHGSTRWIKGEESLRGALNYVHDGQGPPLD